MEATKERHLIYKTLVIEHSTSLDEFCSAANLEVEDFWVLNESGMPEEQRMFLDSCSQQGHLPSNADNERMAMTKSTGRLEQGQRVLTLRNNDAENRGMEHLDFLGDDPIEVFASCMLHSRIRIVFMFIRYVFKVAKKNGNVMLQAVLDVFNRHNISYKVQELRGSSFDQALRSLNGNESRKFADVVIPDIIDVIFPEQPVRQAYCKEIFAKWASIDSTLSKKHVSELTVEEVESFDRRLNSFVIRYSTLVGDKELFSAVYFHLIAQGHISRMFHTHLNKFGTTLALSSMDTIESKHKVLD